MWSRRYLKLFGHCPSCFGFLWSRGRCHPWRFGLRCNLLWARLGPPPCVLCHPACGLGCPSVGWIGMGLKDSHVLSTWIVWGLLRFFHWPWLRRRLASIRKRPILSIWGWTQVWTGLERGCPTQFCQKFFQSQEGIGLGLVHSQLPILEIPGLENWCPRCSSPSRILSS